MGWEMALVKEQYQDFGPTLMAEMLEEHRAFKMSWRVDPDRRLRSPLVRRSWRSSHPEDLLPGRQALCHQGFDAEVRLQRIRLEVNDLTRGLVGKYVDVYEMPDRRIQVRVKGITLPCIIFDPHRQRGDH